ncbi:penicillin-binding protein 1A [Allochromatium palmeri]|uniref:Penicillin-binding protein 1A n=1 Tax=Allochromatium palmeri TaxID=231048 RepID=A0A6N8E8X9_9GAMM|nr:penicillin-binding protein 1A [Allochromatium palmeri]MTW20733.1 PBP1A family penicillin-binding protein [Allochromatium palmeri]
MSKNAVNTNAPDRPPPEPVKGEGARPGSRSVTRWFLHFVGSGLGAPLQVLTLGLAGAAIFVGVTLPDLPDVETLRDVQFQQPLRVYSADGLLIGEFGIERRRPVSIRQIPPLVIQAFLATEDSRFFEHRGIDTQGLGRALLSYATTGEKSQGGSTISMQLTRNFFLSPEKTFQRKLAEVLLTLHVEQALTKEEILELYLNQIFFGHRAYGISAAAALYYDKPLDQLTVAEAAMLAGIPKAPSANNPITNPARALERRDYILGRMLELGYIDAGQHATAIATPDMARAHWRLPDLEAGYVAEMARAEIVRFYGEEAISRGYRVTTTLEPRLQIAAQEAVRTALRQYDRRHGYRGPEATLDIAGLTESELDDALDEVVRVPGLVAGLVTRVSSSGAEIYLGHGERVELPRTALSWARTQRNLARWRGERRRGPNAVAVGDLVRLRRSSKGDWVLTPIPAVSGALVALDPLDGGVRALVGGYAFSDSKFNRAVDMRRQPGSSFKPFVYAAALDKGWTPASLLRDEAVKLKGSERWNPKNADHRELGPISLRRSLALSRNLASINLLQSVGLEEAQNYIRRFGFDTPALPLGLSMVLGTGELSPVKLAEGYAVFANGGYHVTPYFIQRIEDGDGQVVFEAKPARACTDCWYKTGESSATTRALASQGLAEPAIDPRTAYQMTSLLREVVERGTGTRAKKLNRPDIVGKTGTTNDIRDSWFAGYQAEFVTIAWMGFDDFGKLGRGEEGGRAAIGMWIDFMEEALKGRPVATLEPPSGLVEVRVDPARGVETKAKSGVVEFVQEEYRDALLGPEPVKVAGPSTRKRGPSSQRSGPRVTDDLF